MSNNGEADEKDRISDITRWMDEIELTGQEQIELARRLPYMKAAELHAWLAERAQARQ